MTFIQFVKKGSSFTKAKPKHGLSTVAWLATQRLVFLPLYGKWWIQQTSRRIFLLFLLLYCLQIVNLSIYFNHIFKDNEFEVKKKSSNNTYYFVFN